VLKINHQTMMSDHTHISQYYKHYRSFITLETTLKKKQNPEHILQEKVYYNKVS